MSTRVTNSEGPEPTWFERNAFCILAVRGMSCAIRTVVGKGTSGVVHCGIVVKEKIEEVVDDKRFSDAAGDRVRLAIERMGELE